MIPCQKCGGSRHRWDTDRGVFVKCECLKATQARTRYREAGVPARFDDETWRTFLRDWAPSQPRLLLATAAALQGKEPCDAWLLLHGSPRTGRELAASLLLRAACDGGRSAITVDVTRLVDHAFRRDEEDTTDPYRAEAMVLNQGHEPTHKWNRHVLERALRQRWHDKRCTILVVQGDPTRVGGEYRSSVIDEMVRRFKRVLINPRKTET